MSNENESELVDPAQVLLKEMGSLLDQMETNRHKLKEALTVDKRKIPPLIHKLLNTYLTHIEELAGIHADIGFALSREEFLNYYSRRTKK